jgi:NADH-quinone oxidoreductase subunit M
MDHPLSALLAGPLAGLLLVLVLPAAFARLTALAVAAAELALAVSLIPRFDPARGIQLLEQAAWIPSWGASYLLGIDGISLAFVLLSTGVCFLTLLLPARDRAFYAWFLLLEAAVLGSFLALDLLLFFFCFEIVLLPMYFLVAGYGGERAPQAAMKFLIYTVLGSVVLLIGLVALHHQHFLLTGQRTFALAALTGAPLPLEAQRWLFWAFVAGFAVKIPLFPVHTWLPDAHTEAPTAGSVLLAALLLKLGTYGLFRFAVPLFPDAARESAGLLAAASLIAILYGALVCLMQTDWKRLIAYSSISHMGFCTLGLFAFTPNGLAGSLLQQVNHGLSSALLFLLVGAIYDRHGSRELAAYGGLGRSMPVFGAVFLVAILSAMGMPPLNGFVGEVLILEGVYPVSAWWAAGVAGGILLGAAYLLWLYQRTVFSETKPTGMADLRPLEAVTMAPFVIGIVWIGLQPGWLLGWFAQPVSAILGSR